VAFKPSLKKKREPESTELNLLPVMNLIIVLIPMLLSVAKLTQMALLEYLPPAEAAEAEDAGAPPQEQGAGDKPTTLSLLVNIAESGLQVSMFNKVEPGPYFFEIPLKPDGEYDYATLTQRLYEVKEREVGSPVGADSVLNDKTGRYDVFPTYRVKDGREVSITAIGRTSFQNVVRVMDACRNITFAGEMQELFPITILKQFQ